MTLAYYIIFIPALVWWILSIKLVSKHLHGVKRRASSKSHSDSEEEISVFKSSPRVSSDTELTIWVDCLKSFLKQMNPHSELLIGIHPDDLSRWQPKLDALNAEFPDIPIKRLPLPEIDLYPNPKISNLKAMSSFATKKLWLWSDIDITASDYLLRDLTSALNQPSTNFVTVAYRMKHHLSPCGILDALFVNAEFLPGAILMGQKPLNTSFGAGILFHRDKLLESIWNDIGRHLADDFILGNRLGSGRLCRNLVETSSMEPNAMSVICHYWRWHKTIRWLNPLGYLGQFMVLPLWVIPVANMIHPHLFSLREYLAAGLLESLWGLSLLLLTRSDLRPASLPLLLVWPWIRALVWILTWFPLPVKWRASFWWTPKQ